MLGAMSDPFLGWNVLSAGLRPEPFLILLAALALDAVGGNRLRRYAWHPQRVLEATVACVSTGRSGARSIGCCAARFWSRFWPSSAPPWRGW